MRLDREGIRHRLLTPVRYDRLVAPDSALSTASRKRCCASSIQPSRPLFFKAYDNLLNHLADREALLFGDAVHQTHAVRPVGCWGPKDKLVTAAQTSGRQRVSVHGAIDLETGQTRMLEALPVNAASTIMLLAGEAMYSSKRMVHLFSDNARYHHANLVQAWMDKLGRRINLHFIPTYCPHLNRIERL